MFNKVAILKKAHATARSIVAATGCAYRAALSVGIKQAWAAAKLATAARIAATITAQMADFAHRNAVYGWKILRNSKSEERGSALLVLQTPNHKDQELVMNAKDGVITFTVVEAGSPKNVIKAPQKFDAAMGVLNAYRAWCATL